MLDRLVRTVQRMAREAVPFDPSGLEDEVALRTEWGPAKRGGANFRTHSLERIDSNRLEFTASAGARLFYAVFFLVGVGIVIGFTVGAGVRGNVLPIVVGVIFAAAGAGLWYVGAAPIVFDKRKGSFWKGRTSPYDVRHTSELKHHAPLDRIHALQIISEYIRGNKSSYYSYELNLVLDDGSRLNVVDHGNVERLRADARVLSEFLDKPVWDATA
jgi:hypothetical protein